MDNRDVINHIRNFMEHNKKIQEKFRKDAPVGAWHLSEDKQAKYIKDMMVQAVNLAEIVVDFDSDIRKMFIKKIEEIYDNFLTEYDKLPEEVREERGPDHFSKPYVKYIPNMKEHFEKEVYTRIFGGLLARKFVIDLLHHVHTFNELLHVLHAICIDLYKIEDEAMNEKMRILGERDSVIIAIERSIESVIHRKSRVPFYTNILSFNDKKIVQLRDYGHATVIEVHSGGTINDNTEISIDYRIPKCTEPFFEGMPGFEKKKYTSPDQSVDFAMTGKIKTTGGKLIKDLANLIYHIPTDEDMGKGHL